jgi:hypothetical protein
MESYVERPPLPGLAGVVRTVWIQRTGAAAYVQRHLPTGGVEIHFPVGGQPQLLGPLTGCQRLGPLDVVLRALASLFPQAVGNERCERLPGRVSPADAKRMPGRVRVDLVALGGIEIRSWLEQSGAEGDRLFVRGPRVVDVEVEMHLLGSPMRPVGWNVVGDMDRCADRLNCAAEITDPARRGPAG